jgi:hypothetical protein
MIATIVPSIFAGEAMMRRVGHVVIVTPAAKTAEDTTTAEKKGKSNCT